MSYERVMVIGLDGATFDLMGPWIEQGRLPNLAKVVQRGSSAELESVNPPESPLAWTSFATGKNPGKHGIFGFYEPKTDGSYTLSPINAGSNRAATIYRILSDAGRKPVLVSVPFTFPPEPLENGVIIPGEFSIPGEDNDAPLICHPPSAAQEVKAVLDDPRLMVDTSLIYKQREQFIVDLHRTTENVMALIDHYLDKDDWDYFMTVFNGVDQVEHYFFRDFVTNGEFTDAMLEYYEKVDVAVGRMLERAGDDTLVMIMSDHGMTHFRKYFCLNLWLQEQNHLAFKQPGLRKLKQTAVRMAKASGLSDLVMKYIDLTKLGKGAVSNALSFDDVDFDATKAYAYGFGSIRINLQGREANGIVHPTMYESVRDGIIAQLKMEVDPRTGLPLFDAVYKREEVYSGPCVEAAPDIIVQSERFWPNGLAGVGPFANLYSKKIEDSPVINGMHTMNGIFMAQGENVKEGFEVPDPRIIDLAPTVLYALGLPIPDDMDGRVLSEMFEDGYFEANQPVYVAADKTLLDNRYEWREDEEAMLLERLRDLGYMA